MGLTGEADLRADRDKYRHLNGPFRPTELEKHLFGDGGVFTQTTFSEFLSAVERSKIKCKSPWSQRFKSNFWETNEALPGFGAPALIPGIGITSITSSSTAGALGTLSPLKFALGGFQGATVGGVAAASAVNVLLVTGTYESGVVLGSAVNAKFGFPDYCSCGE